MTEVSLIAGPFGYSAASMRASGTGECVSLSRALAAE